MRAPTTKELESLILDAMKDRAPVMFRRLSMAGQLEQVIADRAEAARETATDIFSETKTEILKNPASDLPKQAGRIETAQREAWNEAILQAVEFLPEDDEAVP